jgi:hypothetical protein
MSLAIEDRDCAGTRRTVSLVLDGEAGTAVASTATAVASCGVSRDAAQSTQAYGRGRRADVAFDGRRRT